MTVLQQIFDLNDERTCEELAFNQKWHYALDIFEPEQQHLSLKTLCTIRQVMTGMGLDQGIFKQTTYCLVEVFNVDTRFQRLDSVHIHSNMARLGRVRLNRRKGSLTAFWEKSTCKACSFRTVGKCPAVKSRQGYRLPYLVRDVRISRHRKAKAGKPFKGKYHYRAGIEGTNSRYVNMLGVKRLRYRGLERVRFAGITKALGINLFRTAKYVRETGKLLVNQGNFTIKSAFRTVIRILGGMIDETTAFAKFSMAKPELIQCYFY